MEDQNSNEVKDTNKLFTQEQVDSIIQKRLTKSNEEIKSLREIEVKYEGMKQVSKENEVKQSLIKQGFKDTHINKVLKLIDKDKDFNEQVNELKQIKGFINEVEIPKTNKDSTTTIKTLNIVGEQPKKEVSKSFNKVGRYNI